MKTIFLALLISLTSYAEVSSSIPQALEYFKPIRPGEKRDASLLRPLTLEPLSVSIDDFKKQIQRRWKLVYHCGGEPMTANLIFAKDYADGYYEGRVEVVYTDGKYTVYEFPPESSRNKTDPAKAVLESAYSSSPLASNRFLMESPNDGKMEVQVMRIRETGEMVMEGSDDKMPICKPGVRMKALYVAYAPLIS